MELIEPVRHLRGAVALLLMTGLGLGIGGCGSSGPTSEGPVSASSSSSAPSATATPTTTSPSPTPAARPLSRFENKPQVKVLRKWAAAVGRAINAKDRSLRAAAPYSTAFGMTRFPSNGADDYGLYYPGPLPFTPVRVGATGGTSLVTSCLWLKGWGQNRKTKLPARKRVIAPVDLVLKKENGKWKVNQTLVGSINCSQVPVKGVPW